MNAEGVYAYAEGYVPWSTPSLYDTTEPGKSARGHEDAFRRLTPAQKRALIEFLKLP